MTSACLIDMIVDDKSNMQNIIPNKKRPKLTNNISDQNENSQNNQNGFNLKAEHDLKRIYPFLSVEVD